MTFPRVTIDQATSLIIDHRGKTPKKLGADWTISGHRVISAQNIKGSRIDENDHHYVDSRTYAKWMKVPLAAGDTLLTSEAPLGEVAYLQYDVDWVLGQRLYALRTEPSLAVGRFLFYALQSPLVRNDLESRATGTTVFGISQVELRKVQIPCPPIVEQQRIAEVLGALDDKIESNLRVRNLCRDLGGNLVADTVRSAPSTQLEHYAASISRGVTPQYYKDEDASPVLVLNQKCIRDGWVTPELARLMIPRAREKSQAIARLDDLLVNSTGQGTLGRVARWDSDDPIYVDSHVTVVKADPGRIYPVLMPYLVFPLQDEIEHMATGSTGQTELSPSRLAQLNVPLLSLEEQRPLSARLVALEAQAHYCQVQSLKLTELRDALLPELMSGRMRVDEAGCLVSEALDEEVRSV
jgi:type I restriction enzyme S subunit